MIDSPLGLDALTFRQAVSDFWAAVPDNSLPAIPYPENVCRRAWIKTVDRLGQLIESSRSLAEPQYRGYKKAEIRVLSHGGFVRWVLHRFYPPFYAADEDAFQEALIGLKRAAHKFAVATSNLKFTTYAVTWIRHEVSRYLSKGRRYRSRVCSLEELLVEPSRPPENFEDHELVGTVIRLLNVLPLRQHEVLRRRYGIDQPRETLETIAHDLGVTKARVLQIEQSALKRMRRPMLMMTR